MSHSRLRTPDTSTAACELWGTALAPIFKAHRAGIPVHVGWTRHGPRNQAAILTAWELTKEACRTRWTADNTGGNLMQHTMVTS